MKVTSTYKENHLEADRKCNCNRHCGVFDRVFPVCSGSGLAMLRTPKNFPSHWKY